MVHFTQYVLLDLKLDLQVCLLLTMCIGGSNTCTGNYYNCLRICTAIQKSDCKHS